MKRAVIAMLVSCAALACGAAPALGADAYPGMEHLHFAAGPYQVIPGANLILDQSTTSPSRTSDGFMIRMTPNLVYALRTASAAARFPRATSSICITACG